MFSVNRSLGQYKLSALIVAHRVGCSANNASEVIDYTSKTLRFEGVADTMRPFGRPVLPPKGGALLGQMFVITPGFGPLNDKSLCFNYPVC